MLYLACQLVSSGEVLVMKIRRVTGNNFRRQGGSLMTEFASAFTIFICCLLIPLINLSVVPVRYVIVFAMVTDLTRKAATAETRSQAIGIATKSGFHQDFAQKFGISMATPSVSIVCKNQDSEVVVFPYKKRIPTAWLPGGSRSQCNYLLQTTTDVEIPPLFCCGPKITALTAPVPLTITSAVPWENLGCDPSTQEFYINE